MTIKNTTGETTPAPESAPAANAHGKIKRPRLLTRAARAGAALYNRDRDLKSLLPGMTGRRRAVDIVDRLSTLEAAQEDARRTKSISYSVTRHVALLTALIAEAMVMRKTA